MKNNHRRFVAAILSLVLGFSMVPTAVSDPLGCFCSKSEGYAGNTKCVPAYIYKDFGETPPWSRPTFRCQCQVVTLDYECTYKPGDEDSSGCGDEEFQDVLVDGSCVGPTAREGCSGCNSATWDTTPFSTPPCDNDNPCLFWQAVDLYWGSGHCVFDPTVATEPPPCFLDQDCTCKDFYYEGVEPTTEYIKTFCSDVPLPLA